MSKININKTKYNFLDKNLKIYKNKNIITNQQYDQITSLYSVKSINTIQIFTILGAILIGLGVLVYVGSNWKNLDDVFKLSLIILVYLTSNFISYKTSKKYKRTSKSILYLGVIIFGAGVMLTQNIFNYNAGFMPTGIVWILGILPTIYIFEEKVMYVFGCIFFLLFSLPHVNTYPYAVVFVYSLIYLISRYKFINFNVGIFSRDIVLYALIAQYLNMFEIKRIYICLIIALIGIGVRYYKFKTNKGIHELEGLILVGMFGLSLTFPEAWDVVLNANMSQIIAYAFSFSYFSYFIYETIKGNIICILPVIALVIRYFSDSLLLALPKSLLFIVVGGILLATGFYIEKSMNKKGKW